MAQYFTTTDVYNTVCNCLLEPFNSGTAPGLSLGIVTEQDFLNLLQVVLLDFLNRTSLTWEVFTQQINFNQSQYLFPENMNEPKVVFLGGQYLDKINLLDLDEYQYSWQSQMGVPQFWHLDGLPPKTLEVALNPNYTGAPYKIPVGPNAMPPFGIYNLFNGATQGQFSGTSSVLNDIYVTWESGTSQFDTNWLNYSVTPQIILDGTSYPIASISDSLHLTLAIPFVSPIQVTGQAYEPGTGSPGQILPGWSVGIGMTTCTWVVNIGNDGNLSIVGTTGLTSITLTLGEIIPIVPDAFCYYLAYGVLARIFSTDGEAKDLQRAAYSESRYREGISLAIAVSGEINAF